MKLTTLFSVFMLCIGMQANAQIFKKLGKKIENAAETTIERKVEQKTRKETGKAFDATFNNQKKNKSRNKSNVGLTSNSKIEPATQYTFQHRAEMRITSGKEIMDVNYFLTDSKKYLCALIKDSKIKEDVLTVFDLELEAMFTFMENNGKKMKMGIGFKPEDAANDAKNEISVKITPTDKTKTILGYHCRAYKMTGENMTATIWVTKDIDLRFPSNFYKMDLNKNDNQSWMKDLDGWAMEMEMIDTSKRKPKTITMTCLSINASNLKINSNDYQNIGNY